MNPLNTVRGAITTGFVAALVLSVLISPTAFGELSLARWLHIVAGITWIGLLYYFNLVQIPAFAKFEEHEGGARARNIALDKVARKALWGFRWASRSAWK